MAKNNKNQKRVAKKKFDSEDRENRGKSPKNDMIEVEGKVLKVLPGYVFKVELSNGLIVEQAHVSGKMRMHYIRIVEGDRVKLELSPYDLTRGRITYRM